jgi:putative (di)nucleoside polyphosphate hydrolase
MARGGRRKSRPSHELPYRPCVGIALFNLDGLVFVGRRRAENGAAQAADGYAWQMPQGGIDRGESPYDAAIRELHEETGVRSVAFIAEAPEWYAYDLPSAVAGRAWRGRYRGQTQKWFAFRFTGPDEEIDIGRPGGHKPEFDEWRWEILSRLPSLIIPFKRPVYEKVVAAFAPFAAPAEAEPRARAGRERLDSQP